MKRGSVFYLESKVHQLPFVGRLIFPLAQCKWRFANPEQFKARAREVSRDKAMLNI